MNEPKDPLADVPVSQDDYSPPALSLNLRTAFNNAEYICYHLAAGRSRRQIANDLELVEADLWNAERRSPEFRQAVEAARGTAAHRYAEEAVQIADNLAKDATVDPVKAADKQIQTRQWLATRWAPETYSEKAQEKQPSVNISTASLHLSAVQQAEGPVPAEDQGQTIDHEAPCRPPRTQNQ